MSFSATNTGILTEDESKSTAKIVNVTKNSSVTLHWNYTYGGDTLGTKYIVHVIAYKDDSGAVLPLATRVNEDGILRVSSSMPLKFDNRIKIIGSNNTMVIDRVNYNDSSLQFLSYIIMRFNGAKGFNKTIHLKPDAVRIVVKGK